MMQGDIHVFLNALGRRETDSEFSDMLSRIGADALERSPGGEEQDEYIEMPDDGVEILLKNELVHTIFIYATRTKDHSPYEGWQNLIQGVSPEMDQATITSVLGEPLRLTKRGMTYQLGDGYLQFSFVDGQLTKAVVMNELVGGMSAPPVPVPVEGDFAVFMAAVGAPIFSPEHVKVIALGGAKMEIQKTPGSGGADETHFFGPRGFVLAFKDNTMAVALVRLTANESGGMLGYPWPEKLITGVATPWTRGGIRERFGVPLDSNQNEDVFVVEGRFLKFVFEGELCTEASIMLAPVGLSD